MTVGQKVRAGEVIGTVGNTACVETALEPHLQGVEGLENLESHSETKRAMPQDVYPSKAASFKAAADALHGLLGEIAQEA